MGAVKQRKVREIHTGYIEQKQLQMEHHSKSRKGLYRRLTCLALFLLIVVVGTALTLHTQHRVLEEKLETREEMETTLARLQMEERNLKDEVVKFNDLEYIAEIARRDYFLTKPGEIIFKLPQNSSD